ncbi:hypothetical protein PENTCL1PPCAC_20537 [Pristionchus entomophagus]|uniref:Sodium/nucleoside cotransporter n=1 Tax=Pristionchus entomophagus TaxID=358040 RepID=A0AAV5TVX8_9BILA|nr:hypothetical protein PENTCL1PPCAC_20537 [Pristionchus entomophagus]
MRVPEPPEWWVRSTEWLCEKSGIIIAVLCMGALHGLLIAAAIINFQGSIALLVCLSLFWIYVIGTFIYSKISCGWWAHVEQFFDNRQWISTVVGLGSMVLLFAGLIIAAWGKPARLYSIGCLVLLILLAILGSDHPSRIKWRPVVSGILLQYVVAFLVLYWSYGQTAIAWAADQLVIFLGYAKVGTSFVFNFIPAPPDICGMDGPFAFTSLPILVYFSAICAVLYYTGILQWVLRRVSVVLQGVMGTTAAESLNAVASSFMGPTEAAVLMRYALPSMTQSEIVATMAVGFSMVSGSLFATYISFGACAPLLLAANVMSAPATLVISKIWTPETQQSRQKDMDEFEFPPCEDASVLQAISNGAYAAVEVVFAIIANLIVYLALIEFLNSAIEFLASLVGVEGFTFDVLMGYIFFPLAFIMGSSTEPNWDDYIAETLKVAQLIGQKTILNEFVAYQSMQGMLLRGELHPRGQLIAVFALCGYSNPSNIGSVLAQFVAMCPKKSKGIIPASKAGFYIGSLACFMTACVAGSLIDDDSLSCMPDNPADTCLNPQDVVDYFNRTMSAF